MIGSFNARRLTILCVLILLVLLSVWIGGFIYFTKTSTWADAKSLILSNKSYPIAPGEDVKLELKGFSYRFSGDSESFQLNVRIEGSGDDRRYHVDFERTNGKLRLVHMTRN